MRARYAGNAMMDQVAAPEFALPIAEGAIHVALLPGSRSDAPQNARAPRARLLRMSALSGKRVQAFLALAPAADVAAIIGALKAEGFDVTVYRHVKRRRGDRVARRRRDRARLAAARARRSAICCARRNRPRSSGHRQRTGCRTRQTGRRRGGSRPESPQSVGWYRMRQQKLLGEALVVLQGDDDAFARDVLALLADRERVAAMGAAGRERMGGPERRTRSRRPCSTSRRRGAMTQPRAVSTLSLALPYGYALLLPLFPLLIELADVLPRGVAVVGEGFASALAVRRRRALRPRDLRECRRAGWRERFACRCSGAAFRAHRDAASSPPPRLVVARRRFSRSLCEIGDALGFCAFWMDDCATSECVACFSRSSSYRHRRVRRSRSR